MYPFVGAGGADQNTCVGLSIKDGLREGSSNVDDMVTRKPGKKFLTFPDYDLAVR